MPITGDYPLVVPAGQTASVRLRAKRGATAGVPSEPVTATPTAAVLGNDDWSTEASTTGVQTFDILVAQAKWTSPETHPVYWTSLAATTANGRALGNGVEPSVYVSTAGGFHRYRATSFAPGATWHQQQAGQSIRVAHSFGIFAARSLFTPAGKTVTNSTPSQVPTAPSAPILTGGVATLSVRVPALSDPRGATITGGSIQITTAADTGFASPVATLSPAPAQAGMEIATGITAAGSYIARARWTNSVGDSAWSATSASATVTAPATPGQFGVNDWIIADRGGSGSTQNWPRLSVLRPPPNVAGEDIARVVYRVNGGAWLNPQNNIRAPGASPVQATGLATGVAANIEIAAISMITNQVIPETISAPKSVTPTLSTVPGTFIGQPLASDIEIIDGATRGLSGTVIVRLTSTGRTRAAGLGVVYWRYRQNVSPNTAFEGGGLTDEAIVRNLPNGTGVSYNLGWWTPTAEGRNSSGGLPGNDAWGPAPTNASPTNGAPPTAPEWFPYENVSMFPTGRGNEIGVEFGPQPGDNGSPLTAYEYRLAPEVRTTEAAHQLGEIGTWGPWQSIPVQAPGSFFRIPLPDGNGRFIMWRARNAIGAGYASHTVFVAPRTRTLPTTFTQGALNPANTGGEWIARTATSISSVSAGTVSQWAIDLTESIVRPTVAATSLTLPCTITFNDSSTLTCSGLAANTYVATTNDNPPATISGVTWRIVPRERPYRNVSSWLTGRTAPASPLTIEGASTSVPAIISRMFVPAGMGNINGRAGIEFQNDPFNRRVNGDSANSGLETDGLSTACDFLDWTFNGRLPRERDTEGLFRIVSVGSTYGAARIRGGSLAAKHQLRWTDPDTPNIIDVWTGLRIEGPCVVTNAHVARHGDDPFVSALPINGVEFVNCSATDIVTGGAIIHPDFWHIQERRPGDAVSNTAQNCRFVGNIFYPGKETTLMPPFSVSVPLNFVDGVIVSTTVVKAAALPGLFIIRPGPTDHVVQMPVAANASGGLTVTRARNYAPDATGNIRVRPAPGETINGSTSDYIISGDWRGMNFTASGTNWTPQPDQVDVSVNGIFANTTNRGPMLDCIVAMNIDWAKRGGNALMLRGHDATRTLIGWNFTLPPMMVGGTDDKDFWSVGNRNAVDLTEPGAGTSATMYNVAQNFSLNGSVNLNYLFPASAARPDPAYAAQLQGASGSYFPQTRAQAIAAARPVNASALATSGAGPLGVSSGGDRWNYSTGAYTAIPDPALLLSVPAAGQTRAVDTPLFIRFDQPVKPSGSGTALLRRSGVDVPCTVLNRGDGIVFVPTTLPLTAGSYTMEVSAGYMVHMIDGSNSPALNIAFTIDAAAARNWLALYGAFAGNAWRALTTATEIFDTNPSSAAEDNDQYWVWNGTALERPFGRTLNFSFEARGTNSSVNVQWFNDGTGTPAFTLAFNVTTGAWISAAPAGLTLGATALGGGVTRFSISGLVFPPSNRRARLLLPNGNEATFDMRNPALLSTGTAWVAP